ncbi:unnamed protein product [Allacma fusca]|uniref:BHLH domain-containing protein n=1 Tax=Allacma fusca TaxID=39272 RepID=A0A8J2K030_9HEXA|nr:unnamed protein product [Allacma fusca]
MDPCRDFNPLDLGDQESGIDLAFDMSVILNGTLDEHDIFDPTEITKDASLITPPSSLNYYQLKSKPVNDSSPSQTNYKVMPRSRTNFKQELMREQTVQEEKRQAELKAQQQRHNIQSASVPFQSSNNNVDVPVPPQVLRVQTRLENPTYYHLKHSQQRQVRQYLNHSVPGSVPQSPVSSPLTALQTDGRNGLSALSSPQLQQRLQLNGPFAVSAPPTLLNSTPSGTSSPAPQSSLATSLNSIGPEEDVEAYLVEDILSLEADRPNSSIVQQEKYFSPTSKTLNDSSFATINFGTGLDSQDSVASVLEGSAPVSPDDHVRQAQAKDRQKKDNHNMIERRRRFNINDRIKELGTLLPRNQDDPYFDQVGEFRPNKGTILKASVDYIKLLKGDSEKLKPLEAELKRSEMENRRHLLRIQELEKLLKLSGIPLHELEPTWKPGGLTDTLGDYIKAEVTVKKEPDLLNHCEGVSEMLALDDLMEDDSTVVTGSGDPMLTQTLDVLDEIPSQQLHDGMDFF